MWFCLCVLYFILYFFATCLGSWNRTVIWRKQSSKIFDNTLMFYAHVSVSSNLLHSYVTETEIINTMQKKIPSNQNICLKDWKHHWYLSRRPWKSMTLASHLYVCEQLLIGILCLTQIYNVHVTHIASLSSASEQVVGSNVPVWIRWWKQPILYHNNQIQHESILKD